MKKHSIVIIALLLFILPAYAEVTEWIYITRGNHFLVMDPQTRKIIKQESLPEKESYNIFTTPGGKFLFLVASHDDTKAIVIDTETHAVMHSETLPPNTTRIAFSSMGDRMYSGTDTKYVSVSDHRRSRFSNTQTLQTSLGTGEIAFNRRGTRIYGNNKTGLAYFLEQDLSIIQEIRLRKVYNWFAASNFRFLFGIALDKTKIVSIDERKAKKIAELKVDVQDAKINNRGDTVFVLTNNEILRLQFPEIHITRQHPPAQAC